MLISYNILKRFLPKLTIAAEEVAEELTKHSFETVVAKKIEIDQKVTVGRVEKIKKHPDADRLKLVTVNVGKVTREVVCGADNLKEGVLVPFSPVGTLLRDDKGEKFELKGAKIRGVESLGMLNSPRELDLGDWHGGIYILSDEAVVGRAVNEYIPADTVLEADITPNRAHDCLSHWGIANEIAAICNLSVVEPALLPIPSNTLPDWRVAVEDDNDCARYLGVLLEEVKVEPSPMWLQASLWAMGAKPVNNVVDITNYVMFEYGNPNHAFKADFFNNKEIVVRRGVNKEVITALDENSYEVNEDDLLITDGKSPVAIAGIIGGKDSQVTADTESILLEVANFRSYLIQQSSSKLKIETESSARFKKDLSPSLVDKAAQRGLQLLSELAGAQVMGKAESRRMNTDDRKILFNPQRAIDLAGVAIDEEEMENILQRLRCKIEREDEVWQVRVPEERLDLIGGHDLAEEVIRLFGLDKIKPVSPDEEMNDVRVLPDLVQWRETIRDILTEAGMTETYNYSFDDEVVNKLTGYEYGLDARIKLVNPPAPERAYLRRSLIPQMLGNVIGNKAEFKSRFTGAEKALFEIGQVFIPSERGVVDGIEEREMIGGVFVGKGAKEAAAGAVARIERVMGVDGPAVKANKINVLSSEKRAAKKIGQEVAFFEIDLKFLTFKATNSPDYELQNKGGDIVQYIRPSKYPPSYRDLSVIVDDKVSMEMVQEIIERVGGKQVADVDLFDEYQANDANTKSLAWHIAYQSDEKTLTVDEVNAIHNKIVAALKEELEVELRE